MNPVIEVKWWSGNDWVRVDLVDTIGMEFPAYLCPMPEADLFVVVGYGSGGVTIKYIGGNEQPAYDVRINGGPSMRGQLDSGQCNFSEADNEPNA